jgi:hypothetical protein
MDDPARRGGTLRICNAALLSRGVSDNALLILECLSIGSLLYADHLQKVFARVDWGKKDPRWMA